MFGYADNLDLNLYKIWQNPHKVTCYQIMGNKLDERSCCNYVEHGEQRIFIHAPHYIAPSGGVNPKNYDKLSHNSVEFLTPQLNMSSILESATIVHPGYSYDSQLGLNTCANNCKVSIDRCKSKGREPLLLIENMASQARSLCSDLDELIYVVNKVKEEKKLINNIGACIDTCHLHAAGYDLTTDAAINDLFSKLKPIENDIVLIHLNDCDHAKGSKRDRHADLLTGCVFTDRSLKTFVNKCSNAGYNIIMETPTTHNIDIITRIYNK